MKTFISKNWVMISTGSEEERKHTGYQMSAGVGETFPFPFGTKTDMDIGVIEIIPRKAYGDFDDGRYLIPLDQFIEIMNHLPPEVAAKIDGHLYKQKA